MCVLKYSGAYLISDIHEDFLTCGWAVLTLLWVNVAVKAERKQQISDAPASFITLRNSCSSPFCQVLADLAAK